MSLSQDGSGESAAEMDSSDIYPQNKDVNGSPASEAYDSFFRKLSDLGNSGEGECENSGEYSARLVSASESPSFQDAVGIKSLIFRPKPSTNYRPSNAEEDGGLYIVAVVPTTEMVDLYKISKAINSSSSFEDWELAPSYLVEDLCGFRPGTVPPFGHSPTPSKILVDRGLVDVGLDRVVLGGGGTEGYRCLFQVGLLLKLEVVKVADVVVRAVNGNGARRTLNEIANRPKPFFPVAPPGATDAPDEDTSDASLPHEPVAVTAVGRLTSVRRMAKRLVFADLAPPDHSYEAREDNEPTTDPTEKDMLWRSGTDGLGMSVQIIVGKTFCDSLGEVEGPAALKELKPGRLVVISGRANVNPDSRNGWKSSVGNWLERRNLDVIISSFEVLDNCIDAEDEMGQQNRQPGNSQSEQGQKRPLSTNPDTPILGLADFNAPSRHAPFHVTIVDTPESAQCMSDALSKVVTSSEGNDEAAVLTAGIDCEWRPTTLYSSSADPQPVALLQVSLPALGQVFLVDTHVLLRPSLVPSTEMSPSEWILSHSLERIFLSKSILKLGFHVAADLRRLAASFPHIPAFRTVHAVVELSTLARRVYPETSRHSTGSLARLTRLVSGFDLSKEQQCSDWILRPLTPKQVEYAALDCAIPPYLFDRMSEDAGVDNLTSIIPQFTSSWRFLTFDSDEKDAIRRLKAKRVVGNTFVVTQSWITGRPAPSIPSVPKEGEEGPYTDKSGVLQVPSHLVAIRGKVDGALAASTKLLGKPVGKSKAKCIDLLAINSMFDGARLEYNPRSGFIEFLDGMVLFVNMPDSSGRGRRTPYPNEWLEDGKILTWYLREKDWKGGTSAIATKLCFFAGDSNGEAAASTLATPQPTETDGLPPSLTILFVRTGDGEFICCGQCAVSLPEASDGHAPGSAVEEDRSRRKLVKLHLELIDRSGLQGSGDFLKLVSNGVSRRRCSDEGRSESNNGEMSGSTPPAVDSTAYQEELAKLVLDGDVIGALGRALDGSNTRPEKRSISAGIGCLKNALARSNEPTVLRAVEILDDVAERLGLF